MDSDKDYLMDSDNKDKNIYWIRTTTIRLFNGFEQQG